MSKKLVLVTGANGFIGRILFDFLSNRGYEVRAAVRREDQNAFKNCVAVGDIGPLTDWSPALVGVDTVIHLAARAHIMKETASDPLSEYRRVNAEGTEKLANMSAQIGVRRLIFLSSIGVNGKSTTDQPFAEGDPPSPQDDYAIAKLEAEIALRKIAIKTGLETVVLRTPLVYGPGVKGNFLKLISLVDRRLPLPLGCVKNRRSFLGVDNLVEVIHLCITNPSASGETFLVSDGEDLSTPDLIQRIAKAFQRSSRLFPFPVRLMRFIAKLARKEEQVDRLCGSLQVDSEKVRRLLCWKPAVSVDEGLEKSVNWFLGEKSK